MGSRRAKVPGEVVERSLGLRADNWNGGGKDSSVGRREWPSIALKSTAANSDVNK